MKRTFNIVLGILCLVNVIYKLVTCMSCPDRFFGMEVSGPVFLLIWTAMMILIFYGVYRDAKKEVV